MFYMVGNRDVLLKKFAESDEPEITVRGGIEITDHGFMYSPEMPTVGGGIFATVADALQALAKQRRIGVNLMLFGVSAADLDSVFPGESSITVDAVITSLHTVLGNSLIDGYHLIEHTGDFVSLCNHDFLLGGGTLVYLDHTPLTCDKCRAEWRRRLRIRLGMQ